MLLAVCMDFSLSFSTCDSLPYIIVLGSPLLQILLLSPPCYNFSALIHLFQCPAVCIVIPILLSTSLPTWHTAHLHMYTCTKMHILYYIHFERTMKYTVWRTGLWRALEQYGVGGRLLRAMQGLYQGYV